MESEFKSLNFDAYAKTKFGQSAHVICLDNHFGSWRIVQNGKQFHIDINDVALWQYGYGYRAVATGIYKDDWCAINFNLINWKIIPIVVVSDDKIHDIQGVRNACNNLISGLDLTRDWYYNQMGGKTFNFLERAIIIHSADTSLAWNDFAFYTDVPDFIKDPYGNIIPNPNDAFPKEENRWLLINRLKGIVNNAFGPINNGQKIICIAPYTGRGMAASGAGAAAVSSVVAEPPFLLEFDPKTTTNPLHRDGTIYAIGHELGHEFGLIHSCSAFPGNSLCSNSIMENPSLHFGDSILLYEEKQILNNSMFFN